MNNNEIKEKVKETTGITLKNDIQIVHDTSDFSKINRDMILDLEGELYLVRGDMFESRFTLEGYPKFWVKNTFEIATGTRKIIKCVFNEEFSIKIGPLNIKCFRSGEKEGQVLDLVKDNPYFMQGKTLFDIKKNPVRVLDYISGNNFYEYLNNLEIGHEEYFFESFPGILANLKKSFQAIQYIHENGLYHGDIRNDHIIMEESTGTYRWIDFDLNQHFSDFDVWSIGNIILLSAGKGEHTFKNVKINKDVSKKELDTLSSDDASAFFRYRIINLKKLFPYMPDRLNDILMRFSLNTTAFYESTKQIIDDIELVIEEL